MVFWPKGPTMTRTNVHLLAYVRVSDVRRDRTGGHLAPRCASRCYAMRLQPRAADGRLPRQAGSASPTSPTRPKREWRMTREEWLEVARLELLEAKSEPSALAARESHPAPEGNPWTFRGVSCHCCGGLPGARDRPTTNDVRKGRRRVARGMAYCLSGAILDPAREFL